MHTFLFTAPYSFYKLKLALLRIIQNVYYICSGIADKFVITMKIYFEDVALEELYISGATSSNQYHKLAKDVVKQYVKL